MVNKQLLQSLQTIVSPKRVSFAEKDLLAHAKDASFHDAHNPDVVVWVNTTKEVSRILRFANKHSIPVTAWGGGSSLQGNPIPVKGGIVMNMTNMNKVLEIIDQGFQVRVQPGVVGDVLNKQLEQYGLFFPAFPGSSNIATIGGLIANNAGGMYAVKYGVTADWVMELEVVLANGDVIRTGTRALKSVSGYNLLPLFIGSEGTLGIITEATLRLAPLPQAKMACLVSFQTIHAAADAILAILHSPVQPAAFELMDESYVTMINRAQTDIAVQEFDTLLIELHGAYGQLQAEMIHLEQIARKCQCVTFETFTTEADCERVWSCRKGIRIAFREKEPHTGILSAEVAVPLAHVPSFIHKSKELREQHNIRMLNHGHMGDGNFHTWALYDVRDQQSLEKAEAFNEALTQFALSVGGTASGEHGLGMSKRQYLPVEHPTTIHVMQQIKQLFDPKGILNPGKIFPEKA